MDDMSFMDDDFTSNCPSGYWEMKDGSLIKISKMSDIHLINALNMCKRKAFNLTGTQKKSQKELLDELEVRKARHVMEQEFDLKKIKSEIDEALLLKKEIKQSQERAQEKTDRLNAIEIIKKVPGLIKKEAENSPNSNFVVVSLIGNDNNKPLKGINKFVFEMLETLELNPKIINLQYNDGFAICINI